MSSVQQPSHPTRSATPDGIPGLPRVLYIHPGPVPPSEDRRRNATAQWAPGVDGTILSPSWLVETMTRPIRSTHPLGLHGNRIYALPGAKDRSWATAPTRIFQFLQAATHLSRREGRFDLVMAYGTLATGLSALILSKLWKVPLIIEFPGHPFRAFLAGGTRRGRGQARIAKWTAELLVRHAARIRLLYPDQLQDLTLTTCPPMTVGHDYLPVSQVPFEPASERTEILSMGFPWQLKGMDLLILAFRQIADRHPDVMLRIVGHCPDRSPFVALVAGHPRIALEKAVPNEEALDLISRCQVFALASRTEAMGKVLLEAMAAGRPIVASRVDGIPHYVQDGINGLLFESENVADLAEKLDRVLSDAALRRTLGENGRRIVMEKYSEAAYARSMVTMFYETLGRTPPADLPGIPAASSAD